MSLVHLLATDRQRSVLDDSRGTARAYTAYGATIQGGAMSAFCGERLDALTGCYHLGNGHRQFNPVIMRFHSPDALAPFREGGLNAYMYCKADPINRHDPTGAVPVWVDPLQRALIKTLHVVTPTAMLIGPVPEGALAVNATRLSLLGSVTTATGAGLGLAGVTAAPYVSAVGTTALTLGASTRLVNTIWSNWPKLISLLKNNPKATLNKVLGRKIEKKHKASPPKRPKKRARTVNTEPIFTVEGGAEKSHTAINIESLTNNITLNVNVRSSV